MSLLSVSSELKWPTISTNITSDYAWRNCPEHGWEHHTGIDIGAVKANTAGDPVYSADYGTIVFSGWNDDYGNVNLVNSYFTEQNFRLQTRYAHMDSISPTENVISGQIIGRMGNTGPSYGVHLHYETREIALASDVWSGVTKNPLVVHSGSVISRSINVENDKLQFGNSHDGYGFSKNDEFFTIEYICNAEVSRILSFGITSEDIEQVLENEDCGLTVNQSKKLMEILKILK